MVVKCGVLACQKAKLTTDSRYSNGLNPAVMTINSTELSLQFQENFFLQRNHLEILSECHNSLKKCSTAKALFQTIPINHIQHRYKKHFEPTSFISNISRSDPRGHKPHTIITCHQSCKSNNIQGKSTTVPVLFLPYSNNLLLLYI